MQTGGSRKETVKALSVKKRIEALNREIKKESAGDEVIEWLQSVPGVGPVVAFAFVSHVAAERFDNAGQVSNYLGLVPRVCPEIRLGTGGSRNGVTGICVRCWYRRRGL